MRKALAVLTLLALTAPLAQAQSPGSVLGEWNTQVDKATPERAARVRISPCGAALCGQISWLKTPRLPNGGVPRDDLNRDPAKRGRQIMGMAMLTGFKPEGPGRWGGGQIYNPNDGRSYKATLSLKGADVLIVKGCYGPFCRSQTWTRVR
jgi:uncharacterized protein (DUF2147 family)